MIWNSKKSCTKLQFLSGTTACWRKKNQAATLYLYLEVYGISTFYRIISCESKFPNGSSSTAFSKEFFPLLHLPPNALPTEKRRKTTQRDMMLPLCAPFLLCGSVKSPFTGKHIKTTALHLNERCRPHRRAWVVGRRGGSRELQKHKGGGNIRDVGLNGWPTGYGLWTGFFARYEARDHTCSPPCDNL